MASSAMLPNHLTFLPMASSSSSFRSRQKPLSFSFCSSLPTSSSSSSIGSGSSLLLLRTTPSKPRPARSAADEAEPAVVVVEEEAPENETTVEEEEGEEVEEKPPRKPIVKLGDIMGILNKRAVEAAEKERPVPDIRTGDVVEIKLEVPENRRRASTYKGIVISKQNAGIHTTIRIRRIIAGIGVEIVFPVYSPNIKELKVVSHRKVRRARLYYLRDKLPRLSTFK
ncbi:50S ribosomal protein L19-1, chloroplastic-like [Iris pallida]|uniref:50S ribosomal protein L19-1, chloroplastic-like n=1 Tax=Iris pallida TaxID=29817 RepID=A0AAX6DHQ1_IRIPA|nr:50S ribosomal protein L19-1, chloroplastic-like [Iris pallida]